MLETYDPKWGEKWDLVNARVQELQAIAMERAMTMDEIRENENLAKLLCRICDAGHKTANDYIALHLSLLLAEAKRLGIPAWIPVLPDDTDFDTTQAAVAGVYDYVMETKRRRQLIAVCEKAGVIPRHASEAPRTPWEKPDRANPWPEPTAPPAETIMPQSPTSPWKRIISAGYRYLIGRSPRRT